MAGLTVVADLIASIGLAAKAAGAEAVEATRKLAGYTSAVDELATRSTTAGITNRSGGGSLSAEATSLGSPGDAEDMAARMVAALDKAARR